MADILHVEHRSSTRTTLRALMRGHNVIGVPDIQTAREAIQAFKFDVIIAATFRPDNQTNTMELPGEALLHSAEAADIHTKISCNGLAKGTVEISSNFWQVNSNDIVIIRDIVNAAQKLGVYTTSTLSR